MSHLLKRFVVCHFHFLVELPLAMNVDCSWTHLWIKNRRHSYLSSSLANKPTHSVEGMYYWALMNWQYDYQIFTRLKLSLVGQFYFLSKGKSMPLSAYGFFFILCVLMKTFFKQPFSEWWMREQKPIKLIECVVQRERERGLNRQQLTELDIEPYGLR